MTRLDQAAIRYDGADVPAPGVLVPVADGVYWLRMPLPFALDHINLWVIADSQGCTLVDAGLATAETKALWQAIFASTALPGPVNRVIVTHFHPDHIGLAGWLCQRWDCPLWMTHGEWATGRMLSLDRTPELVDRLVAFYRRAGCTEDFLAAAAARGNAYAGRVGPIPPSFHRLRDGDRLDIGGRAWEVIVGRGHAPEHATLYCAEIGLLISGDQILPRISPNVAVWPNEPEAEPLNDFLASLERFADLPAETFVLPSHDRPFRGLHARLDQLAYHHEARLSELHDALAEPRTAMEAACVLFRRPLDHHQTGFAVGETLAHLHLLRRRAQVARIENGDAPHRFRRV